MPSSWPEGRSDSRIIAVLNASPAVVYWVRKQTGGRALEAVSRKQRQRNASFAPIFGVFEASEGTRHAGTLWQLENKVLELSIVDAPTPTRLVIPLRFVLVVAGKKGPPRKNPVALAGTEAWLEGGAILRRLVFSVDLDLVALLMQPY